MGLAVARELQRSGIGRQLMHHAEEVLRRAGCMKINLQVVEGNDGAVRFYETLGFSTEKRISMGKKLPENVAIWRTPNDNFPTRSQRKNPSCTESLVS